MPAGKFVALERPVLAARTEPVDQQQWRSRTDPFIVQRGRVDRGGRHRRLPGSGHGYQPAFICACQYRYRQRDSGEQPMQPVFNILMSRFGLGAAAIACATLPAAAAQLPESFSGSAYATGSDQLLYRETHYLFAGDHGGERVVL